MGHKFVNTLFDEEEKLNRYKRGRNAIEETTSATISKISIHDKRFGESKIFGKYSVKYTNKQLNFNEFKLTPAEQIYVASNYQSAVVKAISYGKGKVRTLALLDYVSRENNLTLEDDLGTQITSRKEVLSIVENWKSIYFDTRKNSRDVIHLLLSAPIDSDRNSVKKAARETLRDEFGNQHEYLFVMHNDTEHPHIHAVICMRSIDGKKMDPRKQFLLHLRKKFAKKCRDNGLNVEASRRYERGLCGKSHRSEWIQMAQKRQENPAMDKRFIVDINRCQTNQHPYPIKHDHLLKKRNQTIRNDYRLTAKFMLKKAQLAPQHQQDAFIRTAQLLADYSKNMPQEITRFEQARVYFEKQQLNKLSEKRMAITRSKQQAKKGFDKNIE